MNKKLLAFLGVGITSHLLAGCVVYMPMQCAAPQITDKQQAEVTGSTYLNSRVEVAGTYSPVRHLLVRAAYSNLRDDSRDSIYYRGHQYDVGVGTYWRLGSQWLVGGLGGFGQAHSAAAYSTSGYLIGSPTRHEFSANYNKVFGEVYGTLQASEAISLGAAYRVTQVNFTSLTDQNSPLALSDMTRSEPMVFMRVRIGDGATENRPVQLQATWGTSSTFGYKGKGPYNSDSPGVHELKQSRGYLTVGITVFPHCLFRKDQADNSAR